MRRCLAARAMSPKLRLFILIIGTIPFEYVAYAYVDRNLPDKKRIAQWNMFSQRCEEREKNTWVSLGKLHDNAARVLFLSL